MKGLGHAEMMFLRLVWWPAYGNFDDLYPQYEVRDFRDGVRYIDFAYILPWFRIAIEIDGYGPHGRDVSRDDFGDDRDRQTDLVIDRWEVARFSYDRVKDKPRACEVRIRLLLDRCREESKWFAELTVYEREIVRLIRRNVQGIRRMDVEQWLHVSCRTAGKLLHQLVEKKMLVSAEPERTRVHRYMLAQERFGSLQR